MADAVIGANSWDVALEIDRLVVQMFARVTNAITGATLALLSDDRDAALSLLAEDARIDSLHREIEVIVARHLTDGTASADRARYLMTVLRMLPELERSGDLADHIARQAQHGRASQMSARARGRVERMGEIAASMWHLAADAFGDRISEAAVELNVWDDELDSLSHALLDDLAVCTMSQSMIIELTLVARFYERLGDHAVNLARQTSDRLVPVQIVDFKR
jgi:phosphate transport system protein